MYLIVLMVIVHHLEIPKDQPASDNLQHLLEVKENALIVDNNVSISRHPH